MTKGVRRAGSGGGGGGAPNPENQFENVACILRGQGDNNFLVFLHQKCLNVNSSGHREPQILFQPPHANCDDSVMILCFVQGAQTWLWT